MNCRYGILFLFSAFICFGAGGQDALPDSLYFKDPAMNSALQIYSKTIGGEEMIYNGVQYVDYKGSMKGDPFYLTEYWEEGTVWYDGQKYVNVPLLYDISRDELVIKHFDQQGMSIKIKVYEQKVSQFSFLKHTFIRIQGDTINSLQSGYYEVLYTGKTRLIAKHIKSRSDEMDQSTGAHIAFNAKDRYFILKDGKYFHVTGIRSVLKVMKDKKSPLKQFARSTGLKFGENMEQDLISMVGYYDKN